ncbi:MAG: hypothetical protein ACO3NK_19145, partial [Prochlorotrichaceae cyanobacterium]
TIGDSSAGGTVNFNADSGSTPGVTIQTLDTAGGAIPVAIAPGVIALVSSQATAIAQGTITQAQADTGIGSGGAVIDLSGSPAVINAIVEASTETTVAVPGSGQVSVGAELNALGSSETLASISVTTPSGATVTLAQVLSNVSAALGGGDGVILPTALNDASIALLIALGDSAALPPGARAEVGRAARAIAALLSAARN